MQGVKILHGSFEICLDYAKKGDFIYMDPPYHPLSDTANFTSYTKDNFGKQSQEKLHEVFKILDEMGCKLILSNSYSPFTIELYKDYQINFINAKRAINSNVDKRGVIKEILVLN